MIQALLPIHIIYRRLSKIKRREHLRTKRVEKSEGSRKKNSSRRFKMTIWMSMAWKEWKTELKRMNQGREEGIKKRKSLTKVWWTSLSNLQIVSMRLRHTYRKTLLKTKRLPTIKKKLASQVQVEISFKIKLARGNRPNLFRNKKMLKH